MPLRSHLLRGDAKLEAAAVSDPAHITPGTVGECVRKIQMALIQLDGAAIDPDGIYGPATANAVLQFKRKRGIVNRAYQTTADNIVGKMTVAALDAELLGLEQELTKRPRIVEVYPRRNLAYRQPLRENRVPVVAISDRKAKSFADKPTIIFPGQPFEAMELKVSSFGSFQVVDGKGGIVKCWEPSVGVVSDPGEPSAHTGDVRVTRSPQTFRVFGRSAGKTFIEARKSTQAIPHGDLVTLIVVAHSDKLTWNPSWKPRVTGTMSCNPWGARTFGPDAVPGMMLKSPLIEFKGSVNPDSTVARGDFELGILQTLLRSKMEAVYIDANNRPTWTLTIGCTKAPMRDAADESPLWYHKDDVKQLSSSGDTTVESNDSPQTVVPWQTKNKKGTLVSTSGTDGFCTWLAVRQRSTDKLTFLNYAVWSVDWGCNFDFKTERRTITGGGALNGQGAGQGPFAPIITGKPAIEETTMDWTGPPGAY